MPQYILREFKVTDARVRNALLKDVFDEISWSQCIKTQENIDFFSSYRLLIFHIAEKTIIKFVIISILLVCGGKFLIPVLFKLLELQPCTKPNIEVNQSG